MRLCAGVKERWGEMAEVVTRSRRTLILAIRFPERLLNHRQAALQLEVGSGS
jgi:hypothetical protein